MKIASVAEAKAGLTALLRECENGPVIITKNGRAVAALVSARDEDDLERLILAHTPRLRRLLEAAQERVRETGGVPHDDFWQAIESGE